MAKKIIFLSHDKEDLAIVSRVFRILNRINMFPYMFEIYPEPGEDLPVTIRNWITRSDCFVVFLTTEGVKSQWVNQEVGIAYAYGKPIIPINEEGVESEGFVKIKEHIPYDSSEPEEMIRDLLHALRLRFNQLKGKPKGLELECACEKRFKVSLPANRLINEATTKKRDFTEICPSCTKEVKYSWQTLEVVP